MLRWLALILLLLGGIAYASPSIKQVESAFHLTRGAAFSIDVGGEQMQFRYIGIEPQHGHRYAIIIEAY